MLAVLLGLLGIYVAWALYAAKTFAVPQFAFAQRVLEHKFYFDELYDAVFYRPAVWLAEALFRGVEDPLDRGVVDVARRKTRVTSAESSRASRRGSCAPTCSRIASGRRRPRRRLHRWSDDDAADRPARSRGARCIWVLPLNASRPAPLALLAALAEVGLWIELLVRYDFAQGRPPVRAAAELVQRPARLVPRRRLRLLGLARRAHGRRDGGRDRVRRSGSAATALRAYMGLMLFLTGAIVGVFTAQDLLLFYAFFEAMLIPLYVLVGVWGGPGRLGATLKFVIYTMAGSLLMLVSIIVYGLSQGTFDLVADRPELERLDLPRLRRRVRDQGAALPVPRLAARRLPRVVAGGRGDALGRRLEGGRVRLPADRDREVPRAGVSTSATPILVLAAIGLIYGSLLAFRAPDIRGVIAYSSLAQMGLITLGLFAVNDLGFNGAVLQMVNHGLISAALFLLAGMVERRTLTGELVAARRDGARPAGARDRADDDRRDRARRARCRAAFAGEFLILAGVFQQGWG